MSRHSAYGGAVGLGGNVAQCPPYPDGSQARPPQNDGCQPGFIPAGCDGARRLNGSIAAGATITVELGTFQTTQPVAMVDIGSGADITLDDIIINGESQFVKVKGDQNPAFIVAGLGLVSGLTAALIEAGANPWPVAWAVDQNNQVELVFTNGGGLAQDLDVFLYLANPGRNGGIARKNG